MRITTLVENESILPQLGAEHGLSLYVEANDQKILFDMGRGDLFAENAALLNCPISDVDLAVISHGHYDHGGGLATFLTENKRAKIYLLESAFLPHRSKRINGEIADIGLDVTLQNDARLVFVPEQIEIENGITLFSGVRERDLFSSCNQTILMECDGTLQPDDFEHEQSMLINEGNRTVLIAGCAHCGIVNILRKAEQIIGRMPDVVVSGFHLHSPSTKTSEPEERIRAIGDVLAASGAVYYSGHCTGSVPYSILKEQMGDQLNPLHAGIVIDV